MPELRVVHEDKAESYGWTENWPPVMGKILRKWIRLLRVYSVRHSGQDLAYWWSERANVGTLLGAVWGTGGCGLVEFATKREIAKRARSGRADLYMALDKSSIGLEAKQRFLGVTGVGVKWSLAMPGLQTAHGEAAQRRGEQNRQNWGLVFALPYIAPKGMTGLGAYRDRVRLVQSSLSDFLRGASRSLCSAFYFPVTASWRVPSAQKSEINYRYPGIVVLADRIES